MDVLTGILKHLCEVSVIAPFFQMRKLRPRPLNHWPRITSLTSAGAEIDPGCLTRGFLNFCAALALWEPQGTLGLIY